MVAALVLLAAAVYDPLDPAQFVALFRARLERVEAKRGQRHADTARAAADLALLLNNTGDPGSAEPLLRRAIGIDPRADYVEELGVLLATSGRAREALALWQRALASASIPQSARLLSRIASLQEAAGDIGAAEQSYRQALAAHEKAHGAAAPQTGVVCNDLGLLLENREQFKDAEEFYRRALGIFEKAYGSTHPEIGTTLNNLAGVVGAQGRIQEAEPLLRRAVTVLEQTLGRQSPRLAAAYGNLGDLLAATGRGAQARPFYQRALAIYEAVGEAESARLTRVALANLR
jgi:tetratricopeptide (TPR) repeat protein